MVKLNEEAYKYAKKLIEEGRIDTTSGWSFDTEDENELLENGWEEYKLWFLGIDDKHGEQTKARYKFPYGKNGKVYRRALIAIKQRASQYNYQDIYKAADALLAMVNNLMQLAQNSESELDIELDTTTEWVHILPAGKFSGRDGRGPYWADFEAIIENFKKNAVDLVVDYEHQTLREHVGPAPAAGWIKDLEVREDGLYAKIEWTPQAEELIRNKEYRYISPVFVYERNTGRVIELQGAGLTHYPNLHLKAINSQNTELVEIAKALNTEANLEAILNEINKLKLEREAHQKTMEVYKVMAEELNKLRKELKEKEIEELIAQGRREGKLIPALEDWARDYASKDLEGFKSWLEKAPAVFRELELDKAQHKRSTLTEEDLYVCKMLGIDPQEFEKLKEV